jgi:hypothetical protein
VGLAFLRDNDPNVDCQPEDTPPQLLPQMQQEGVFGVSSSMSITALPGATFGRLIEAVNDAAAFVAAAEADPDALLAAFYDGHGLVLIRGLQGISGEPELLLRLSRLFGEEVEDYRTTTTPKRMVHPTVPQIFVGEQHIGGYDEFSAFVRQQETAEH